MDPFASLVDFNKNTTEKKSLNGLASPMKPQDGLGAPLLPNVNSSSTIKPANQMKTLDIDFSAFGLDPPSRTTPSPSKPNTPLNSKSPLPKGTSPANQDHFGDIMSGFGQKTDQLKQPIGRHSPMAALAHHQKDSLSNTWDLGFLESATSKPPTPSKPPTTDSLDLLSDFVSPVHSTPSKSTKPLEPVFKPSDPVQKRPEPTVKEAELSQPEQPQPKFKESQGEIIKPKEERKLAASDFERAMVTIMDMGFDESTARLAMEQAGGDVEDAIDYLLDQRAKGKFKKPQSNTSTFAVASDFGTQLLGTASSMFSYSKKQIGKAIVKARENLADVLEDFDMSGRKSSTPQPDRNTPSSFRDDSDEESFKPAPPVNNSRPTVSATPQQLQAADDAKAKGNELFKRGQFSEAEACYTEAIEALPAGHEFLVFLYNNRAASRLKTGDYRGVLMDCDAVQQVDDTDVKSLLRRAMANEGLEKLDAAALDYRAILQLDSSVRAATQGLARCSRALRLNPEVSTSKPASKSVTPEPTKEELLFDPHEPSIQPSRPVSTTPKPVSTYVANAQQAAVDRLREQERKMEMEDQQKLAAKDQIDNKVFLWKKGKEQNIRALLSSLDLVLWEELGIVKCNLSDLVTPSQVKIRYMKTIAKIHPDKISPSEPLEHKLLANAAFAALNTAWDAFRDSNPV